MSGQELIGLYRELSGLRRRLERMERQEGGAVSSAWSPTLTGSLTAGSLTTTAVGVYVRGAGGVVTVSGYVAVDTFTSAPTGDLRIGGFPFTVVATTSAFQALSIAQYSRINLAANVVQIGLRLEPGATYGILIEAYDDLDVTVVPGSAIRAGSIIIFGGSYICET